VVKIEESLRKVSTILLLFILRENGNRRDFLSFLGFLLSREEKNSFHDAELIVHGQEESGVLMA
jgi:hypothetical protein